MMKFILVLFSFLFLNYNIIAQTNAYSIHASVLSMREQASDKANVIKRIPFGAAFTILNSDSHHPIIIEGIPTEWIKIDYNGTIGYVIKSYTFPIQFNSKNIVNLKEFLNENFKLLGKGWRQEKSDQTMDDHINFVTVHEKQLYEYGINYTSISGHEYIFESIEIPNISIGQAYNFAKLIAYYNQPLIENRFLKIGEYSYTAENGIEFEMNIQGESNQGYKQINQIKISWLDGSSNAIEITNLNEGVKISTESGN